MTSSGIKRRNPFTNPVGPHGTLPAGHQLAPGRAAQWLHVVILQFDSLRRQPVQSRGFDLGAVVAYVPKALIIHQDEDDVRLFIELVPPIAPVLPR